MASTSQRRSQPYYVDVTHPEAKRGRQHVTASNEDEGFAKAIEDFIFG